MRGGRLDAEPAQRARQVALVGDAHDRALRGQLGDERAQLAVARGVGETRRLARQRADDRDRQAGAAARASSVRAVSSASVR